MTNGETREEAECAGRREISARRAKSRWSGPRIILLLTFCCIVSAGAGIFLNYKSASREPGDGLVYEANAVSDDIPGKSREERQWEMDNIVGEGMLITSMSITPSREVSDGCMVNWLIEDPSNQGKLTRMEITRDDTGEKIHETGAIRPGSHAESAPLNVKLSAGVYEYTTVFLAYKEETETLIG